MQYWILRATENKKFVVPWMSGNEMISTIVISNWLVLT